MFPAILLVHHRRKFHLHKLKRKEEIKFNSKTEERERERERKFSQPTSILDPLAGS